MIARPGAIHRLQHRRRSEAGLTLIELLISLMLLVVITGFLAGGFTMGRRAFAADRGAADQEETAAALNALAGLIGAALPAPAPKGRMNFDGRSDALAFVGLSAGHALPGGPLEYRIRRNGGELEVEVQATAGAAPLPQGPVRTVALREIASLKFSYFGRPAAGASATWQDEWPVSDHLPDLIAMRVGFVDPRRDRPALVVALRQG
jgi:general secretion pathway protein J